MYEKIVFVIVIQKKKKIIKNIPYSKIPNNSLRIVEGFKFRRKESHKFISFLFPRDISTKRKMITYRRVFII